MHKSDHWASGSSITIFIGMRILVVPYPMSFYVEADYHFVLRPVISLRVLQSRAMNTIIANMLVRVLEPSARFVVEFSFLLAQGTEFVY